MITITKDQIEEILVKHDPVRLIKIGAPADEYESEAVMIIDDLKAGMSVEAIQELTYSIFSEQFGYPSKNAIDNRKFVAKLIGTYESYLAIAQEIKDKLSG